METKNYLTASQNTDLDSDWSSFLRSIPEQMGRTIEEGNRIFEQKKKKHFHKMSIKYKIDILNFEK